MAGQTFVPLVISIPSPAATFRFFTSEFQLPTQDRYIDQDIVKNQNGKFKWVYDNGPGFRTWRPFKVHCANSPNFPGSATQQLADLTTLWNYIGALSLRAPDGNVYPVIWSTSPLEPAFRIYPHSGDTGLEYTVTVQFEEVN